MIPSFVWVRLHQSRDPKREKVDEYITLDLSTLEESLFKLAGSRANGLMPSYIVNFFFGSWCLVVVCPPLAAPDGMSSACACDMRR